MQPDFIFSWFQASSLDKFFYLFCDDRLFLAWFRLALLIKFILTLHLDGLLKVLL